MGLKHGLSCHARNCWIEAVKLLQKRQRRPYAICGELANCRSRVLCICWNRKGYVFFLCHWIQQMLMLFLYGDSARLLFFRIPENPQNMHVLTRLMSWGIWYYIVMALRKVEKRKKRRILSRRRFSCRAPPC